MMRLVPLLLVINALLMTSLTYSFNNDNSPSCCNSQCGTQVLPASVNFLDIINESPYYFQVTTLNVYGKDLDNECLTYVKNNDNSYFLFIGVRFINGSSEIRKYTASALTGFSGVIRNEKLAQDGASCSFIFDEVYLGDACPELRVYYRNYVEGPCDFLGNISLVQPDFIHGDSPNREVSDYCKSRVAVVANFQRLESNGLVELPNLLDRSCVTQYNGASCVNADRVLPQDSVSVNL